MKWISEILLQILAWHSADRERVIGECEKIVEGLKSKRFYYHSCQEKNYPYFDEALSQIAKLRGGK